MCEKTHYFNGSGRSWAVALPFDLEDHIAAWQTLRKHMIREIPDAFTRDEWAYLLEFLDPENLRQPFRKSFGRPTVATNEALDAIARPRGSVAVWLPNNVSLLGPLTLILISLTGNSTRIKAGSLADDLTCTFVEYARSKLPAGPLAKYLGQHVQVERFDRADPRNREMAANATVRVVFGSDEAVSAVDGLPHPPHSVGIAFGNRQSQAWLQPDRLDEDTLATLIKVFAIYGQDGCTSPNCAVLLNASMEEARRLRDRMIELWPQVITRAVPMHIASENIMARQWASAIGWSAELAPQSAAVLAVGTGDLEPMPSPMTLRIVPASVDEAVARLPSNIQTIGHALTDPHDSQWERVLITTRASRFVPLRLMHHFGPVWDGSNFWRQMFEEVDVIL